MDDQHETQFQDLEWARPRIKAQIKNNKHRGMGASVSGLFTMLRRERHLSLIGDYPILWIIMNETQEMNKMKIKRALTKSQEYKGLPKIQKMWWLKSLSDPLYR